MKSYAQRSGLAILVLLIAMVMMLASAPVYASGATNDHTVLILGSTVTGGASSREALAAIAVGMDVEVVSGPQWGAKSAADFATYRALILGDPTCVGGTTPIAAAEANRTTWSPVVDGNVIIIGTDPVFHAPAEVGAATLINNGVAFAVTQTNRTGLYCDLSCYYAGGSPTALPVMDQFGAFTVEGSPGCFNNAHIVAAHPALAGLTDVNLSNWSCSVHEIFDTWPTTGSGAFFPLVIALTGSAYTAPDGSVGTPYVMVRGAGITIISDITLDPADATNTVGQTHTVTATVTTNGSPVAGASVSFSVLAGPNTGTAGSATTDGSGQASFSYVGSGGVGTDTIIAQYIDSFGKTNTSNNALKTWVEATSSGPCGCMDIVFVQDTTGSMGPPINNVKAGLANIVNAAVVASGGDVRFGLVTFSAPGGCGGDGVEVNLPFTTSIPTITAAISGLIASGGCGEPESSDEALNYTVTGSTPCSLLAPLGPLGPYRSNCVKIAIVDTDARPGGCDDTFTPGVDDVNAASVATAAAANGIKVSAVYNETNPGLSPTIVPIMQNYATATGGEYVQTPSDGSGTDVAIEDVIAHCGGGVLTLTAGCDIFPTNDLCVSGIVSNSGTGPIIGVVVTGLGGNVGPFDLNPGQGVAYNICTVTNSCGVFTNAVTATGFDIIRSNVVTQAATAICGTPCPDCPICDGSAVVVTGNVTINFNTGTPTYSGDPALLPYFTFDKSGPTPDTWKAIFDVGGASLLITSNATITTTQVPANTNNRRAPGIEIHSTCTLQLDQGSYITVDSVNRQAGNILIQVDGPITINGVVSNAVEGTRGRPGNITIASECGSITTGPKSKIITYGDDFGGSDINLAVCKSGDITINGLVDASYKALSASTIRIAAFGGSVNINGTTSFGTEVVAGTLRTVTSGVSVRSRRDPLPGTILIQASADINVQGSTLLSKLYPNYGAVAVKTASNSSKGGVIDARAGGQIQLTDRSLDNANRFDQGALTRALAGGGIGLQVSASIDNGASNNSKPVVTTQAGDLGKGGKNELRGEGTGVNVGPGAKVLADFTGRPGGVGTNILSGCTSVNIDGAAVVSPADDAGDNTGTCGSPDQLFLDCTDLGINFGDSIPI